MRHNFYEFIAFPLLIEKSTKMTTSTAFLLLLFYISIVSSERELVPLEAPANLTLLEIKNHQILIEWSPIDSDSVRGNFRGYLVRAWNHATSQVYAFPAEISRASIGFFPHSKNFITVAVKNDKYVGPPSEAISFDAPQIEPNPPKTLSVFPLSNASVLLKWTKPNEPNGILVGYKIYVTKFNDSNSEKSVDINDAGKLQAKIANLTEGIKYRIAITAVNCAGESDRKFLDVVQEQHSPDVPSTPQFSYKIGYKTTLKDSECDEHQKSDKVIEKTTNETNKNELKINEIHAKKCFVDCIVTWLPDVDNNPGENFYIKYRLKSAPEFNITEPEINNDFIILHKFNACRNYEIVLVAQDGVFEAESRPVLTPTKIT